MTSLWIYLCFFLSGFSGLVYEVVWSRLFVYTMGSSHLSIAVVVSVFMGGLALGSAAGGWLADRASAALRLYGWMVILAGILSVAVIPEIYVLEPLLRAVYRLHDGQPGHIMFTLVKVAVCAATILLPTTLMGATLPLLVRHLSRSVQEVGRRIGALYAVNTFGAVAGSLAAGFFMIPRFGLGASLAIGGAIDVAAGALALVVSSRSIAARGPVPAPAAARPEAGPGAPVPLHIHVAVAAFGAAGFANMCLQLGWTRALVVSVGNSTYSFSVIVGIFIFGLAAGGWIAGLFADRLRHPAAAFGWLLVATAGAASLTIPSLGLSPARFAWTLSRIALEGRFDFGAFFSASAWQVAWMILPATVLMGMAFPIAGRLRVLSAPSIGQSVGMAYAANTTGAILGTAVTGFILMPYLGRIWSLLYLAVGIGLAAGVSVLLTAPATSKSRRFALLGGALAILGGYAFWTRPVELREPVPVQPNAETIIPASQLYWNPVLLAQGAYTNVQAAAQFASAEEYASKQLRSWKPLYYRDGIDSSVAVMENFTGMITLHISGKVDASAWRHFNFDLQTQLLMGHLPLLLHPAPEQVLNLGLGCGMSLGAVATHAAVREIDLLEISRDVVEAAHRHFNVANKNALADPRVKVIIGDGRNHLAFTTRMYDIISSEPSNFWIAGLGNLFTREYYQSISERLKPGGILCQWIYGYYIREQEFKLALRTILQSFPHSIVWTNSYGDAIILSSRDPLVLDRARIAARLGEPAVHDDLARIGIETPESLFRYLCAEGTALRGWVGDGEVNRDLYPLLEFRSPLGIFGQYTHNLPALMEAGKAPISAERLANFSPDQAAVAESFRTAGRTLVRCIDHATTGRFEAAIESFKALVDAGDDAWGIYCASWDLAKRFKNIGDPKKRAEMIARARSIRDSEELLEVHKLASSEAAAPVEEWEQHLQLAMGRLQAGQLAETIRHLEAAERLRAPAHRIAHIRGVVLGLQKDMQGSIAALRDAFERWPPGDDPEKGHVSYNMAYCYEVMKRYEDAVASYRLAIDLGYPPVAARIALARCLRLGGKTAEAAREAEEALKAAQLSGTLQIQAAKEFENARQAGDPQR